MLKRISNLIRGFFGMAVSGIEKRNPEALLEVEAEGITGCIAGRAIYEGKLDFAAAVKLAAGAA